jgi:hypothetical protein
MLIIALPEQHYNNPSHIRQLYPQVGPMHVEALPFRLGWVWQPHRLTHISPYPIIKKTCVSNQELGPNTHFPLAGGARSPQQLQNNITSLCDLSCPHETTSWTFTFHVDANGYFAFPIRESIEEVMPAQTSTVPRATPRPLLLQGTVPEQRTTQIAISPSPHL